jgi:hypothetical protein
MDQRGNHPAFPQPADLSSVLWRYMDSEKFQWMISCGRLLMASADRFGDFLEGTTPEGDLEWWRRAELDAASEEHRRIIDYNRRFQSRWAQKLRSNYYVSCWHMNQNIPRSSAARMPFL